MADLESAFADFELCNGQVYKKVEYTFVENLGKNYLSFTIPCRKEVEVEVYGSTGYRYRGKLSTKYSGGIMPSLLIPLKGDPRLFIAILDEKKEIPEFLSFVDIPAQYIPPVASFSPASSHAFTEAKD